MKRILIYGCIGIFLAGCISSKKSFQKTTDTIFDSPYYENQFTGFIAVDAETKNTLYTRNSHKYFTPASNTKIFTLYASLQILPDSIPALKYIISNDTLFVTGTGDPSFLHPHLRDSTALNFLNDHENIAFFPNNFQDDKFGPGWSWGDYQYYYQPERNSLPLFGNVVTLHRTDSLHVTPSYFKDSVIPIHFTKNREIEKNTFYYATSRKDTIEIPFRTDTTLTRGLLEKELDKKITLAKKMPVGTKKILYGMPSDSVYKRMMHESDNFIAEQLLVLAASTLSDTLKSEKARDYILENQLSDLRQSPRWVDGSGLSRYNLFSPESMVQVLHKMYREIPRERLFNFFPAGGVSGTLENWYPSVPEPYIYAKTGSLSNNHCLSGYLLTKSGKTVIFSFMNNHFLGSSSEVKKRMQRIFEDIRDTY